MFRPTQVNFLTYIQQLTIVITAFVFAAENEMRIVLASRLPRQALLSHDVQYTVSRYDDTGQRFLLIR